MWPAKKNPIGTLALLGAAQQTYFGLGRATSTWSPIGSVRRHSSYLQEARGAIVGFPLGYRPRKEHLASSNQRRATPWNAAARACLCDPASPVTRIPKKSLSCTTPHLAATSTPASTPAFQSAQNSTRRVCHASPPQSLIDTAANRRRPGPTHPQPAAAVGRRGAPSPTPCVARAQSLHS